MTNEILKVGNKIELSRLAKLSDNAQKNVFISQVLDITLTEIIAAMPISEGRIIPLEIGTRLEAYFYTSKGIYRAECNVIDRGKEENVYVMKLALTSELNKFQRRQFYRLPCSIEAQIRIMSEAQVTAYSIEKIEPDTKESSDGVGMIVDISGGGIRMMTTDCYSRDDYMFMTFPIDMNIGVRTVKVMGRVVASYESLNREHYYDVRVQFKEFSKEQRELLIKYIFEQQRKIQHKERG